MKYGSVFIPKNREVQIHICYDLSSVKSHCFFNAQSSMVAPWTAAPPLSSVDMGCTKELDQNSLDKHFQSKKESFKVFKIVIIIKKST